MSELELSWLLVGFIGQALFFMRFFIQWITSERVGKSVIPISFWYYSLFGGMVLLSYAIYKQDPVFILGQSTGVFVYSRNLFLVYRERKLTAEII